MEKRKASHPQKPHATSQPATVRATTAEHGLMAQRARTAGTGLLAPWRSPARTKHVTHVACPLGMLLGAGRMNGASDFVVSEAGSYWNTALTHGPCAYLSSRERPKFLEEYR